MKMLTGLFSLKNLLVEILPCLFLVSGDLMAVVGLEIHHSNPLPSLHRMLSYVPVYKQMLLIRTPAILDWGHPIVA